MPEEEKINILIKTFNSLSTQDQEWVIQMLPEILKKKNKEVQQCN